MESDDSEKEVAEKPKKKGGKKKGKKKTKGNKLAKDMITNERGEVVTMKEYTLEKTLDSTTKSLKQCQERLCELAKANENLQETLQQQEKDALEVIAALHKSSEDKELQVLRLNGKIETIHQQHIKEKQAIVNEYEAKIADIGNILNEKESAFKVMQQEFSTIKDFRKKRHQMIQELEAQKEELVETEKRHKEILSRMEKKFFEEKVRLQKEAKSKIGELAAKAHKEAVLNLKETTKEVFKENIRMAEALKYHVEAGEELTKTNSKLVATNRQLEEDQTLHNVIVKEKIQQTKEQAEEVKQLKQKIQTMEHALAHVVTEFEQEREMIGNLARQELEEVRKVVRRLRTNLSTKTFEMKHIKALAQHILRQRSELEKFFMESLEYVKSEIVNEKQKATTDLKPKLIPPLNNDSNVKLNEKKDLSDLSWVEKEKVLRVLFAKMNGVSLSKTAQRVGKLKDQIDELREPINGGVGFASNIQEKRVNENIVYT